VIRMDSRQLDQVEFELLKGTETMVNMIKNRKHVIGISSDIFDELLDYLDVNAERLYYVRNEGSRNIIYFESPTDKENVTQLLRQYIDEE
jgi:N-acyl-L-homoserine lactone synthetase